MRETVVYERVYTITLDYPDYKSFDYDTPAEAGRGLEEWLTAGKRISSVYAHDRKVQS